MGSKTLADLVEAELGVSTFTRDNPVTATVGIVAETVARLNPNRVALLIVNLSVNNIHVGHFRDVAATKGIFLSPSGGNMVLHYFEDFNLVGLEWYGIASAAASQVLVTEWLTQRNPGKP